ncbi:hypothetical protein GUJ93_ZPchr0001g33207 [Zizania palustris]|uniref:Uncharacterized protein n=1 Tax=Zizania palustris TaxID=103762 RepID=A0A8J5SF35_ZIZPA|nr:hypothetical protein GUJ93_ZPchr0001g33207 [Zizania palustris]
MFPGPCPALLLTSGLLAASPIRLSNLPLLAIASTSAAPFFARLAEHAFPWNTLIRLHSPASPRKSLLYLARMRGGAVAPDAYTFHAVLKARGCVPGCRVGLLVYAEAVRRGLPFREEGVR